MRRHPSSVDLVESDAVRPTVFREVNGGAFRVSRYPTTRLSVALDILDMGRNYVRKTVGQRFFEKVEWSEEHRFDDGCCSTRCLEWQGQMTGGRDGVGYGRFSAVATRPQKLVQAHRWLYEEWVGPIAPGLELDHLCRNRRCVNPMHCEPVTPLENKRRAREAARLGLSPVSVVRHSQKPYGVVPEVCTSGHVMAGQNLYLPKRRTTPECRECRRRWDRERKARNRARRAGAEIDRP